MAHLPALPATTRWFGKYSATVCFGNKNYSAWSMRGWLALKWSGMPFAEVVVPMRTPAWSELVQPWSPTERVPALHLQEECGDRVDGQIGPVVPGQQAVVVHDSLAIAQTASAASAQAHGEVVGDDPAAATTSFFPFFPPSLAPEDAARGMSVACEMHGAFLTIREHMPFNINRMARPKPPGGVGATKRADLDAELARIATLWRDCRTTTASRRLALDGTPSASSSGELPTFLLGEEPSFADLMYVPVATRLLAYDVPMATDTREYVVALLGSSVADTGRLDFAAAPGDRGIRGVAEFIEAAQREEWWIDDFEV